MSKNTKQPSEQELLEKAAMKLEKKEFKRLVSKSKKQCKENGLRSVELQLDFLKQNQTLLPSKILSKTKIIEAYEIGITEFKKSITQIKIK